MTAKQYLVYHNMFQWLLHYRPPFVCHNLWEGWHIFAGGVFSHFFPVITILEKNYFFAIQSGKKRQKLKIFKFSTILSNNNEYKVLFRIWSTKIAKTGKRWKKWCHPNLTAQITFIANLLVDESNQYKRGTVRRWFQL